MAILCRRNQFNHRIFFLYANLDEGAVQSGKAVVSGSKIRDTNLIKG
jgi:hypothetical protein